MRTVGHSEARAAADPAWWAWGGTAQQPDLDRFNPVFFRAFDALMHQLQDAGMNVELIVLNFYRRPFTDTAAWTPARERQWLRYLVARYAAFDNVFLWTIANEYETHSDGNYRLDYPADTGHHGDSFTVESIPHAIFPAPDSGDWVLCLR